MVKKLNMLKIMRKLFAKNCLIWGWVKRNYCLWSYIKETRQLKKIQDEAERKCANLRLESLHRHNDHEAGIITITVTIITITITIITIIIII